MTSQEFFEGLHAETLRPWYGDKERAFVQVLLIRAEEAKLYTPNQEHK
jgi:hypothetical protein